MWCLELVQWPSCYRVDRWEESAASDIVEGWDVAVFVIWGLLFPIQFYLHFPLAVANSKSSHSLIWKILTSNIQRVSNRPPPNWETLTLCTEIIIKGRCFPFCKYMAHPCHTDFTLCKLWFQLLLSVPVADKNADQMILLTTPQSKPTNSNL